MPGSVMYSRSPELLRREVHERMQSVRLEFARAKAVPSFRRSLAFVLQALATWLEPELAVPLHDQATPALRG
jgi:hypothetical protein